MIKSKHKSRDLTSAECQDLLYGITVDDDEYNYFDESLLQMIKVRNRRKLGERDEQYSRD